MTKLLVAKVVFDDGSEHTVKTYADEKENPKKVLRDVIPLGAKIVSHEWLDTLSENRDKWNAEHSESPIPMNL